MKIEFTTISGNTFTTNEQGNYFYMINTEGKKIRISKKEFESARKDNNEERRIEAMNQDSAYNKAKAEQEELDQSPCMVDVTSDAYKPAVIDEHGCVDCRRCNVKACVHRDCIRRNPRNVGGLGECPRLSVKVEEEESKDPEIEQIKEEIPGIEDAELEKNIRKAKKPSKPRKSKDIAYDANGITLTAKQVDFIHHLPDTCFWEHGVDSSIWVDCLCDDITGQFEEKPMTVGAMISTLCEKKLGVRTIGRVNGRKAVAFCLTELGKKVAINLGL